MHLLFYTCLKLVQVVSFLLQLCPFWLSCVVQQIASEGRLAQFYLFPAKGPGEVADNYKKRLLLDFLVQFAQTSAFPNHSSKNYFIFIYIFLMKAAQTSKGKFYALAGLAVLIIAAFFGSSIDGSEQISDPKQVKANTIIPQIFFQFDVYCPIDSDARLAKINEYLSLKDKRISIDFTQNKNTYIVIAKTQPSDPEAADSPASLYYCGLARKYWEVNCRSAQIVCSIPGPMFKFQTKQQATIVFVNDIQTQTVNWVQDGCYAPDSDDGICTVTQRETTDRCTYFQPTEYVVKNRLRHRVNQTAVPISPHIHGLEIRPTFDGNPLSWFNSAGQKGPGYNTLTNEKYYSLFNNATSLDGKLSIPDQIAKRSKVVKVTNDQLPGMLFYHDHAMKSTLFNVQNGFSGLYIIYDKSIESKLPTAQNQKMVVFAKQGDARIFVSQNGVMESNTLLSSGNYRIRMLNAHFDDVFYNVSYSAYYQTVTQPDGSTSYVELDPTQTPDFDFTANQHRIPFTIIGTDTTMFRDPIEGFDQVSMGSAERVDILINFQSSLPAGIEFVYIVCYDNNEAKYVLKHRFSLPWATANPSSGQGQPNILNHLTAAVVADPKVADPHYIKSLTFSLPFTDLSSLPDSAIAVKRHRPLFSLPRDSRFMIGAHYMFEMGASENSQIGSVQDFYIVNTLWEAHPIHIHLLNFQSVAAYSLKQLPENPDCTLYFLDYFRLSGLPQFQKNNSELCSYLWNMQDQQVLQVFELMGNYMRQDVVNDRNSGLNSLAAYDGDDGYLVEGCPLNTVYKYICADTSSSIESYRRRWKDTTLVPPYTVYVLRVRWASTSYDPRISEYPYFSVPQDQLVEFPGFVYHCHILPHEDNEMMRPVMLRHSKKYLKKYVQTDSCASTSWEEAMQCINDRIGCPA